MAVVYRTIGGRKIEKVIAMHVDVQRKLDEVTLRAAGKAEAKLAGHRDQGHARITVDVGDGGDRYVVLDDDRGLKAALSIEFGRKAKPDGSGGMDGLFLLHDALGIERRAT